MLLQHVSAKMAIFRYYNCTEYVGENWKNSLCRADNLTTFICQLPWYLGASTSWNPQGLYRTVQENKLEWRRCVFCDVMTELLWSTTCCSDSGFVSRYVLVVSE